MNLIQKIKLLLKINESFKAIEGAYKMNPNKPGWKTSEFWMNIATVGLSLLSSVPGLIPQESKAAVIATTALTAIYTICRTLSKAVATPTNDTQIPVSSTITK